MIKNPPEGIILIDKPLGKSSFYLVSLLRRLTGVRKIGHAGTLDPLATGVMVLLVGSRYTKQSDLFLSHDKAYEVEIELGSTSDSYDADGLITPVEGVTPPSLEEVLKAIELFQGEIEQTPPMYSAKKVGGKKLYELARKGIEIERKPSKVFLKIALLHYKYPFLRLQVDCSKGTYIRSLAHDIGQKLRCGGFVKELIRTRSGPFTLDACTPVDNLNPENIHQLCLTQISPVAS